MHFLVNVKRIDAFIDCQREFDAFCRTHCDN